MARFSSLAFRREMWSCRAASGSAAGASTSIFPSTILAWMVFLRLSDRLNRYGYHPVAYEGQGCTGCGICFFVCPEPGAVTVLRLAAV